MAGSRAQQAAIAISMKKAGKKPKAQKGISVQTVSPTDPYEVYKRKLQSNSSKVELDKTKKLKTLDANTKLKKAEAAARAKLQMKSGGSTPAWTRSEGKNKTGGLNAKGVASYRAANPGSKLQTAVTTKPSKLDPDSKDAKRRKSFCARMSGVKGPMKDEKGRPTRKALSLRKWNC
jgi:hypothetical protein